MAMGRRDFHRTNQGFTLVELLLSLALGFLIVSAAMALLRRGVDINYQVTQRAEMQQNGRVAVNLLARDLSIAGTGIPAGGIGLPSGMRSERTRRACALLGSCGVLGIYANDRLYAVTPGNALGPTINGVLTDAVTLVYIDDSLQLRNPLVRITPSGNQITVDPIDIPTVTNPATGVQKGDILLLMNVNGAAIGNVTNQPTEEKILFDARDLLNLNQPSAAFGNIAALANPSPPPGVYPPTRMARISVVSYFIDNSNPAEPRLMRQVNATPAVPVALNIESLQFTYDVIDTTGSVATAALDNPGAPNQIRKVNISVGARSPRLGMFGRSFERVNLVTSVSIRNLGWFDRYPG